jgi:hypothetical protein
MTSLDIAILMIMAGTAIGLSLSMLLVRYCDMRKARKCKKAHAGCVPPRTVPIYTQDPYVIHAREEGSQIWVLLEKGHYYSTVAYVNIRPGPESFWDKSTWNSMTNEDAIAWAFECIREHREGVLAEANRKQALQMLVQEQVELHKLIQQDLEN